MTTTTEQECCRRCRLRLSVWCESVCWPGTRTHLLLLYFSLFFNSCKITLFPPPKNNKTITGLSWSDVLLGPLPNVYLYAANNPSESIIAKRRGYGTIVSHNVPPYGRAGVWCRLGTGLWV